MSISGISASIGAIRHIRDEAVVAHRHVDQAAHVLAVALQRIRRLLRGVDAGGVADDAGKADQIEPRLLRVGEEELVVAGALARCRSRKSSREARAESRLR